MTERLRLRINGSLREIEVRSRERKRINFAVDGRSYEVAFDDEVQAATPPSSVGKPPARSSIKTPDTTHPTSPSKGGTRVVRAPIPGVVLAILVTEGETVQAGQTMLRLEAMKMENNIFSPVDGVIERIFVAEGEELKDAQPLVEIRDSKRK